ncbi:MAG: DinB family protein [Dehalococcoidia bacterium]
MATQSEELSLRFEAISDEVTAAVTGASDEQWRAACAAEGWTVAAVAHHIAEVQQAFAGLVAKLAAGETYSPTISMDEIDESNARHARDHAAVVRAETLSRLETSRAGIAQRLRGLSDADLERTAGVFGGRELSVARVVEWVVIGHAAEHLASIRATLNG